MVPFSDPRPTSLAGWVGVGVVRGVEHRGGCWMVGSDRDQIQRQRRLPQPRVLEGGWGREDKGRRDGKKGGGSAFTSKPLT